MERVRPVIPTAAERSALDIPSDVAAFAIERLVCSEGAPVEWRQSLVRGDRYSFVVELSPRRVKQPSLPWATESCGGVRPAAADPLTAGASAGRRILPVG